MKYNVISTDDHLQEDRYTWTNRMSEKKWGDKVPQVRENGDGTESWYIFGERRDQTGGVAIVHGAMPDKTRVPMRWEDVPPITYVPSERLKAMERDGVDVHTFFGNVAGVAGNTFSNDAFDEQFRMEAIQAFNDYQIEEWAEPHPGRFITLAIVPMWDVESAVGEVRRTHKRGIKGISFAFPQQFRHPHIADPYWDPLWATAQDLGLSVNFHQGGGGSMGVNPQTPWEGHGAMIKLAEGSTKSISANTAIMTTILFSGMMERFPSMNIVSAESGMGWVPYLLELADHQFEAQRLRDTWMSMKPSEYFRRQCYVNFWYEVTGVKMRDYIGVDNMMWESDYPHPTGTWPDSQDYIRRSMQELTPEEQRKVLVENAVRVFNLQED
jgi:predicted TIM-barrel fold metal-dependent hydrolase